jgi:hypothetical protein
MVRGGLALNHAPVARGSRNSLVNTYSITGQVGFLPGAPEIPILWRDPAAGGDTLA